MAGWRQSSRCHGGWWRYDSGAGYNCFLCCCILHTCRYWRWNSWIDEALCRGWLVWHHQTSCQRSIHIVPWEFPCVASCRYCACWSSCFRCVLWYYPSRQSGCRYPGPWRVSVPAASEVWVSVLLSFNHPHRRFRNLDAHGQKDDVQPSHVCHFVFR